MTVFFHIGSTKTGTTSIQQFLMQNRALLSDAGFVVPAFPGSDNHSRLAVYGHKEDYAPLDIRHGVKSPASRKNFCSDFEIDFLSLLGNAKKNVVLSSEHCFSLLHTKEEMQALYNLIARIGQDIKIIIYVRQQADFLMSQYSTNVITGRSTQITYPTKNSIEWHMDYFKILQAWESVFGKDQIVARIFDREKLHERDVVRDFCKVIGIPDAIVAQARMPERLNESLDFQTIEFLRLFNEHCPRLIEKKINPARSNIGGVLQSLSNKRRPRLPKKIFQRLQREMEDSNKKFRERYIDGVREDPFDWSEKENTRSVQPLELDQAFRLFVRVWAAKVKEGREGGDKTGNQEGEEWNA